MAEPRVHRRLLTVEEHLELEKSSALKHEYVGGESHAMTGVSRRHSRISGNIFRKPADAAGNGPCRVHISDMKARIDDVFYSPDVMVV